MAETTIREWPILFSGPMVRAILVGTKTQTRRIIKPQPPSYIDSLHGGELRKRAPYRLEHPETGVDCGVGFQDDNDHHYRCPYGVAGDRLWVLETWAPASEFNPSPELGAIYWADRNPGMEKRNGDLKWRPSIDMPRWACRLTLEITDVRVERLHKLTDEDAKAEGMQFHNGRGIGHSGWRHDMHYGFVCNTPREAFAALWKLLNGPDSWDANPFVWAISFTRAQQ